jgi:DNA-binding MarR family transcriptional regulator
MDDEREIYKQTVEAILQLNRRLRTYSRNLHAEHLSGRQFSMLRILRNAGERTPSELADYLFVSPSTASEQIGQLVAKGLVMRRRSTGDNRVVRISITEAGRAMLQHMPLGGIPLLRERLGELSDRDLDSIRAAVRRLVVMLDTEKGDLRGGT